MKLKSGNPKPIVTGVILMNHRFVGHGLVTIRDYDTWKSRRRLYDPAFTKRYFGVPSFQYPVVLLLLSLLAYYLHMVTLLYT